MGRRELQLIKKKPRAEIGKEVFRSYQEPPTGKFDREEGDHGIVSGPIARAAQPIDPGHDLRCAH